MPFELPSEPARVRVAPSPTGDPHVGTAYVALFNKALAVRTGGRFVLRIEDTDRNRYVEGSEAMIFRALRWLGLEYDEGPDVGGPYGPYRQSERNAIYREAVETLIARGRAYRCFCTPERLAALREEQKRARASFLGYDRRCRDLPESEIERLLAAGTPHVVRLATPTSGETVVHDALRGEIRFDNATIDDQILLKSDGFPTYHLANVVDDHHMRISHVIRAEEWISSTPKHVLLYEAFGWPMPVFAHLPLLRNPDRTKISKRKNPVSLAWYREHGFLPEALRNFLALLGHSMPDEREVFTLEEFFAAFDPQRLRTTEPIFDLEKLRWLNGEWIRRLDPDELTRRVLAFYPDRYEPERARAIAPLLQPRLKTLEDWPPLADTFFFGCPDYDPALLTPKKVDRDTAQRILEAAEPAFAGVDPFEPEPLEATGRALCEQLGLKVRQVFMVLRVAVLGSKVSPPLFESMAVLGREEVLARLRAARDKLARLAAAEESTRG
ncbi:MAG: glutamate--tRNA ligase [Planctomycetota bacterium]|nr:MAG: glutamate--tRNA ligase [Planctomycetota bacterium]